MTCCSVSFTMPRSFPSTIQGHLTIASLTFMRKRLKIGQGRIILIQVRIEQTSELSNDEANPPAERRVIILERLLEVIEELLCAHLLVLRLIRLKVRHEAVSNRIHKFFVVNSDPDVSKLQGFSR